MSSRAEDVTLGSGIIYRRLGGVSEGPSPTIVTFVRDLDEADDPYVQQAWRYVGPLGYAFVAVGMPLHGALTEAPYPEGLSGWAEAIRDGRDIVGESVARSSAVIDHLLHYGRVKPSTLYASGTSRAGFLALHAAARDERFAAVTAYAPVIDLAQLREFTATATQPEVEAVDLRQVPPGLLGRPAFVAIGDRDDRVGTDCTVEFARNATRAALDAGSQPSVELQVLPEPVGHTTPPGVALRAAVWLHAMTAKQNPEQAMRALLCNENGTIEHEIAPN